MHITSSKLKMIILQEAKKFLKEGNSPVAKYVDPKFDLSRHTHDPKTFAPDGDEGRPNVNGFMRLAKEFGISWSTEDVSELGRFVGFDLFFGTVLFKQAARYDWDVERAIKLVNHERNALEPFLHALWVRFRRDDFRSLLEELALPDDGPGVMIDDPGVKGPDDPDDEALSSSWTIPGMLDRQYNRSLEIKAARRWGLLKYLYTARVIRWTGEGFIGPCPMIKDLLRIG